MRPDLALVLVLSGLAAIFTGVLITSSAAALGDVQMAWRRRSRTSVNPIDPGWRMYPELAAKEEDGIVSDLPRFAQKGLSGFLIDLGFNVWGTAQVETIDERLRRSGHLYRTVGDYYGSKIASAVIYAVVVVFSMVVFFPNAPLLAVVGVFVAGFFGLRRPDERIDQALNERREAVFREMAWVLDRLALSIRAGAALQPALANVTDADRLGWLSRSAGGLFMALLRDLAGGLTTGRTDVVALVEELRGLLPDGLPELDEFLEIVKAGHLGQTTMVADQLQLLAKRMRTQLNLRIDMLAVKSELRMVVISAATLLPITIIVVAIPAVLQIGSVLGP